MKERISNRTTRQAAAPGAGTRAGRYDHSARFAPKPAKDAAARARAGSGAGPDNGADDGYVKIYPFRAYSALFRPLSAMPRDSEFEGLLQTLVSLVLVATTLAIVAAYSLYDIAHDSPKAWPLWAPLLCDGVAVVLLILGLRLAARDSGRMVIYYLIVGAAFPMLFMVLSLHKFFLAV